MSQELLITITAKDGASSTFKSVGSSATQMSSALKSAATGAGGSLKQVGAAAKEADAALDKVGDSASEAASDFSKLEDNATKVGAALGTALGVLSKLGAQAENQKRQVTGIEKAYGSAADQILDFTEKIQQSTKFSNEDAREAAQIAATLAQNYGFTADEIEQLISTSADLATIHGTTLADATQRTAAAMRGEAESAEMLGLTLNQQAIDRENLTLSMSNEEAAHFRLQAMLEQSAYAQGAAGEAAATSAGQAAQAANALQDLGSNLGAALGPVASYTAGMADLALILPVVGAGAGKMIAGLSKATGSMTSVASTAASLVGAINPIGVVLTAAAAGAAIIIAAWQQNEAANAALATSYESLNNAIESTMTAQQQLAASNVRFDWDFEDQAKAFLEMNQGMAAAGPKFEEWTLNIEEQARANELLASSYSNVAESGMTPLIGAMSRLETDAESFHNTGDETIAMLEDLSAALEYNGDGAEIIDEAIHNLNAAYAEGRITTAQYAEGLDYLANNAPAYVASLQAATQATEELTEAQQAALRQSGVESLEATSARWNAMAESIARANDAMTDVGMSSGQGFGLGLDEDAIADIQAYGAELEAARQQVADTANALLGQLVPALDGASGAFQHIAGPGEDTLDVLQRIAPATESAGGGLLRLADGLQDAAQGLDAVLSTFGAIDSLGSRSSGASDIASNLVGDPGTWSTIDDLMSNAKISVDEYNAAVAAGYGIQAKDAAIQENLNSIRAQQLPLLDSQMASYNAYIGRLEQASVAEQQQALYLMDSANQAKVAAAYSTAYGASLGEIPEEVATEIIAEASQADPILKSILENFGLIEVGANGDVSVNFEDAATLDDLMNSIDRLNNTQIQIAIAMADGELTTDEIAALQGAVVELDGTEASVEVSAEGAEEANAEVTDYSNAIDVLSGKKAHTTIDADDQATPKVETASAEVDEFDGKTATATLNIEMPTAGVAGGYSSMLTDARDDIESQAASANQTVTVTVEAQDNASSVLARVMQAASALQGLTGSLDISATDNASSIIARVMAAANALQSVAGDVDLTATDNASAIIARVMQAASALQSVSGAVSIDATDNASTVIARVMQAASALSSVAGDVTIDATDNASSVIARAMQAGNGFDGQSYTADLQVNDSTGGPIAQAMQAANAFAIAYTATLVATDSASSIVSQAMAAANAFAITYTATLSASDGASSIISQAMAAGNAFAIDYAASLSAVDNASGVISSVQGALAALDGSTATVYVNAVDNTGGATGKMLGGNILPVASIPIPTAATGRVVQVGEAGPENVVLPYGSMVQPHPASLQKQEAPAPLIQDDKAYKKDLLPKVDLKEAYKKGGDSAKAFYDGLYDEAKSRVQDQFDEINSEVYPSKEDAQKAQADYERFVKEMGQIGRKREKGKDFDQDQRKAEKAAAAVEGSFDDAATEASSAGSRAGREFDKNVSAGADAGKKAMEKFAKYLTKDVGSIVSKPSVDAQTETAEKDIGNVSTDLTNLDGDSANVNVKVDDTEWQNLKDDIDAAQLGVTVTVKTKDKSEGKKLGGTVLSDEVPHAALGRVITVGEAGPEAVLLPYGSMVVPHPASGARVQSEAVKSLNIYGNVIIHPATSDVQREIQAQFTGIAR